MARLTIFSAIALTLVSVVIAGLTDGTIELSLNILPQIKMTNEFDSGVMKIDKEMKKQLNRDLKHKIQCQNPERKPDWKVDGDPKIYVPQIVNGLIERIEKCNEQCLIYFGSHKLELREAAKEECIVKCRDIATFKSFGDQLCYVFKNAKNGTFSQECINEDIYGEIASAFSDLICDDKNKGSNDARALNAIYGTLGYLSAFIKEYKNRDVLSGVCFVGQLDSYSLGVFLLLPLCIYLVLGAIFLMAGFTSLFKIRTVMKGDGKRTDKLERLMIRIGFFSGLFILPALGFLGCLFYEYYNFDAWMLQWNQDMCIIFSIPCPFNSRYHEHEARPIFVVFMIKYVCSMLVGVTSSVWLYSGKTVVSWRRFIERLQGTTNTNLTDMGNAANLGQVGNGITLATGGNGTTVANSKSSTANLVRTRGQAYV